MFRYLVEDKAKVDRAALGKVDTVIKNEYRILICSLFYFKEYNDARDKEDMNDKNTSVKVPTGLVIFVPNETN